MKRTSWNTRALFVGLAGVLVSIAGCGEGGEGPIVPPPPAPAEYADKHMPEGWWTDEKIIEEGKKLFIGATNPDVNCASCHGKDGKPVKAGARDFRVSERMMLYSDSVWLWRISEGVPNTKMKPWKSKLPEEDRWKLVAFERNFGLEGKKYDPAQNAWIPNDAKMGVVATPAKDGAAPAAGADKGKAADGKAPAAGGKKAGDKAKATEPKAGATKTGGK